MTNPISPNNHGSSNGSCGPTTGGGARRWLKRTISERRPMSTESYPTSDEGIRESGVRSATSLEEKLASSLDPDELSGPYRSSPGYQVYPAPPGAAEIVAVVVICAALFLWFAWSVRDSVLHSLL